MASQQQHQHENIDFNELVAAARHAQNAPLPDFDEAAENRFVEGNQALLQAALLQQQQYFSAATTNNNSTDDIAENSYGNETCEYDQEIFIDMIRSEPCIWNTGSRAYKEHNKKRCAWGQNCRLL